MRLNNPLPIDVNLLILLGALSAATLLWVILYDVFLRRKIRHLWRKLTGRGHHHRH
jgi:hypothetical protein